MAGPLDGAQAALDRVNHLMMDSCSLTHLKLGDSGFVSKGRFTVK
jgi:hypothetical protein